MYVLRHELNFEITNHVDVNWPTSIPFSLALIESLNNLMSWFTCCTLDSTTECISFCLGSFTVRSSWGSFARTAAIVLCCVIDFNFDMNSELQWWDLGYRNITLWWCCWYRNNLQSTLEVMVMVIGGVDGTSLSLRLSHGLGPLDDSSITYCGTSPSASFSLLPWLQAYSCIHIL